MADHEDADEIRWWNPQERAILPIRGLHVPKSLRRVVLKSPFEIRIDTAFPAVIAACAAGHGPTWLNAAIKDTFIGLHRAGFAHSVECWESGTLVGGVYGLAIGGAFCGESMFSRQTNASKVALVHLAARLAAGGFTLLDAQILNDHTARFGAYEVPRTTYLEDLQQAIQTPADFLLAQKPGISERSLIHWFLNEENLKKNLTIS
jgi:leucyl/phenylalanyl-tRNA--protein transferase